MSPRNSCIDHFIDPGLAADLSDVENSQIELVLCQLSGQLKLWKKLVQLFYIVSQNGCATEQLISNILHCKEQYSDDFETPKGWYTTTASALQKTKERLARCYFYIQHASRDGNGEASLFDNMSNQQVQSSPKTQSSQPTDLTNEAEDNAILQDLLNIWEAQFSADYPLLPRQALTLSDAEKKHIHDELSDTEMTNVIRKIDQLLPIYALLKQRNPNWDFKLGSLVYTRNMLASQYQENGKPKKYYTSNYISIKNRKNTLVDYISEVSREMAELSAKDEKRANTIRLRAQQFVMPANTRGPPGPGFKALQFQYPVTQEKTIPLYTKTPTTHADRVVDGSQEASRDILQSTTKVQFNALALVPTRYRVPQLLQQNAIDPNTLTPGQFAAFAAQNLPTQQKSIQLYHQSRSVELHSPTKPRAETLQGISSVPTSYSYPTSSSHNLSQYANSSVLQDMQSFTPANPSQCWTDASSSAAPRPGKAMLDAIGPDDDPFYGLEEEVFGPQYKTSYSKFR